MLWPVSVVPEVAAAELALVLVTESSAQAIAPW